MPAYSPVLFVVVTATSSLPSTPRCHTWEYSKKTAKIGLGMAFLKFWRGKWRETKGKTKEPLGKPKKNIGFQGLTFLFILFCSYFGARGGGEGGSGGAWGRPVGVRSRLEAILDAILHQRDFRTFFVSILGLSWAPQGGANGAQVGAKTHQNRRRKRRCNKKAFKIVLGRSWSRLGAILGPSWPHLRHSWDDFEASGGCKNIVFP